MEKFCISKDWLLKTERDSDYKKVDLPNDYVITAGRSEHAAGGGSDGFFNSGVANYIKYLKDLEAGKHYILDIDGAYMVSEVTFNDDLLSIHPHGYTPYLVDLTDYIVPDVTNKIKIFTNPMQPSTRWYAGGGIYRDVFLWTGGKVRVEPWDTFITTPEADEKQAVVQIKYEISSDVAGAASVKSVICDADGNAVGENAVNIQVEQENKAVLNVEIRVDNPNLWNLDTPYLYTLKTEISYKNEVTDTAETKFGIRTLVCNSKDGLLINGKFTKLRGGCIHHDHGALGAVALPKAEERKIKKLKEAGFNAIRTAHYPPSLALLEVCDREGILVMDEAFDMWNCQKKANDYHLFFRDWYARDIKSMVCRDRNHPSVISYSIGNEIVERDCSSDGAKWANILSEEIRKYDTTRYVTSGICYVYDRIDPSDPEDYVEGFVRQRHPAIEKGKPGVQFDTITEKFMEPLDIVGYNYLFSHYEKDSKKYENRVIWGSETHTLDFYADWQLTKSMNNVLGNFTWTAIDNLGEAGTGRSAWERDEHIKGINVANYPWRSCFQGDLDLCAFRMPRSYYREAIWLSGKPIKIFTTHPEHYGEGFSGTYWHWFDVYPTWTFDEIYIGKPVKCEVYTEADCIEWILNGNSLGMTVPEKAIATIDIPYEKGTLIAIAYKGTKEISRDTLVTTGAPAHIHVMAEQAEFWADNRDLAYFDIQLTDNQGNPIATGDNELTCVVENGELLAFFSGDPQNEDLYGSNKCHAFMGKALAVVRTNNTGPVVVTVYGEDLASGNTKIIAK
ncbi:MAG: DUF4982 domain-containing protein [Clostridia bacterium]|nr:DUF4982 domain-containing protein [Clostridia bacterium]